MAVKRIQVNTLPENAVRVVYSLVRQDPVTFSNLETSSLVLFNVYNYSRSKQFSELRAAWKRDARKRSCSTVKVGQFLLCAQGDEWYRAYVIHVQPYTFTVFFIDYGFCAHLRCQYDKYEELPMEFGTEALESQSYKISLYGVMPMNEIIPLYEGANEPRSKSCDYWLPSHALFLRNELKNADKIFFEPVFREGEIEFGRIYVERDESINSLGDLLIENGVAVECNNEDIEMNRIALQVKEFREERTFDRKPFIRKLLWPNAVCKLEKEEWFQSIEPRVKRYNEMKTPGSSTSTYSSYSNDPSLSDDETCPTSVSCACSADSSIIGDSSENIDPTTENVDDGLMKDDSEYDSDDCAWRYLGYGEYRDEITMEESFKLPEEILMIGVEPYQPEFSFSSLLDRKTLMALKKVGVRGINRTQGYIIPAMLSTVPKDILFVDAPGSGKTVGCLMALITLLRKSKATAKYKLSPRAIFVVPYVDRCEFVHERCNELLSGARNISEDDLKVNVAYGRGKDREFRNMHKITSGCDLLICTPRCLVRMLANTVGFAVDRVEFAVFDEFHILVRSYFNEMTEVFGAIRDTKLQSMRRVYLSNTSASIKPFVIDIDKQMLIMPCHLEAVVYADFAFEILYKSEERKLVDITERLRGQWRSKIVFIMLNDEDESVELMYEIKGAISQCGKPVHVLKPEILLQLNEMFEKLQGDIARGRKPVVLCTDYVHAILPTKVYNADNLVHYSLPADVGTFRKRHAVLLRRARAVAETAPGIHLPHTPNQEPRITVYIHSVGQVQFPRLLNIMSHLSTNPFSRKKANLPEYVENALNEMKRQREVSRREVCLKLKLFGRCDNRELCLGRHILSAEKDLPDPRLPMSGSVEIDIVQVLGPTHFRVRLLKHKPEGSNKWESLPSFHWGAIALKMSVYYGKNMPVSLENVRVGDLVAIADTDPESIAPTYRRVRVMKIMGEKQQKAQLKFVDTGKEAIRNVSALCELPPEFAAMPETMVDVFVCNVLPVDADIAWGSLFTSIIKEKIRKEKAEKRPFIGEIKLALGNCLWLHNLGSVVYDKILRLHIVYFCFKNYLVGEKLALRNEEHLPALLKMCEEAGLVEKANVDCEEASHEENANTGDASENPPIDESDNLDGPSSSSGSGTGAGDSERDREPAGMTPASTCMPPIDERGNVRGGGSDRPSSSSGSSTGAENSERDREPTGMTHASTYTPPINESGNVHGGGSDRPSSSSGSDTGDGDSERDQKPTGMTPTKLSEGSCRPLVLWKQDKNSLFLTIMKNIDPPYIVKHDYRRLYFKGREANVMYKFDELLLHCFDGALLNHYKSGPSIIIRMDKLVKDYARWTRLFKSGDVKWVREELEVTSEEDNNRSISPVHDFRMLATKKKSGRTLLEERQGYRARPPHDLSEDSDSSIPESDSDDDRTQD